MKIDKEEFKRVVVPCGRRMFVMARAVLGDDDDASDAVQQAMLRIWEQRDSIPDIENPLGFSLTVVKRICLNIIRKRKEKADESELMTVEVEEASYETRDQLEYLKKMMDGLPENQKEVLNLSVFGGCSNDEISIITGESASNVRQLLLRARKKLKSIYRLSNE